MKINQLGIQSYQTINKPDVQPRHTERIAEQQKSTDTITLTPQSEAAGSQLAVRASGNGYADLLTPTEKTALELLFAKYQERAQSNATYGAGANSNSNPDAGLGVLLDVKG